MLINPADAFNMPLIVTALQLAPNAIAHLDIGASDPCAFEISGSETDFAIVIDNDGQPNSYDDANDAIACVHRREAIAAYIVRPNSNDTRNDCVIYSRGLVQTVSIEQAKA